jgi:hypothetical protein
MQDDQREYGRLPWTLARLQAEPVLSRVRAERLDLPRIRLGGETLAHKCHGIATPARERSDCDIEQVWHLGDASSRGSRGEQLHQRRSALDLDALLGAAVQPFDDEGVDLYLQPRRRFGISASFLVPTVSEGQHALGNELSS